MCLGAGCEEMVNRRYSHDVGELSRADRINVAVILVWRDPVSGAEYVPPAVTITDPHRIAAAAAFVSRYRDGWRNALSGSGGTEAAFYQGERLLGKIQLFSLGITHEGYARSLTPAEVAELVDRLGIPPQSLR